MLRCSIICISQPLGAAGVDAYMPGLGETVAGLARGRKALKRAGSPGGGAGLAEIRGFGFNPGGLKMLAHVPQGLAPGAALVVVLHGCTQDAAGYAHAAGWLTLADRLGFAVLAPEQVANNNPNRCFNWFEPEAVARGSGEAASIHAMVEHMVRAHKLDAQRVFVTGLSAGGAMTAALLAAYPETFAAGAVIAGLPVGAARNMQEAFGAMRSAGDLSGRELAAAVERAAPRAPRRPRISVWHGGADATVSNSNGRALARQWAAVHGLGDQPDEIRSRPGWTRSLWRGPDGEVLVESNVLAGLGHGTPLAAIGDEGIGQAAPFMLEAGVSSSLEIARFWGLAPQPSATDAPWEAAQAPLAEAAGSASIGDGVLAAVSPHVSQGIRRVIADALGRAGLMP